MDLVLVLALALTLSVAGLAFTLARVRRISAQMAVLTMRVTELVELMQTVVDDDRA